MDIGDRAFNIPFDDSLSEMDRSRDVTRCEFAFLSYVDQVKRFLCVEPLFQIVDRAFANVRSNAFDQREEPRCMLFCHTNDRRIKWFW